jgi:hypothetical protein
MVQASKNDKTNVPHWGSVRKHRRWRNRPFFFSSSPLSRASRGGEGPFYLLIKKIDFWLNIRYF